MGPPLLDLPRIGAKAKFEQIRRINRTIEPCWSSFRTRSHSMSSYLGSASVRADAKAIFDFVSNPENLPKFVGCFTHSDLGFGDVIHVKGKCPHGNFVGVAGYELD